MILVAFLDAPKTAGAIAALLQVVGTAVMAAVHFLLFPKSGYTVLKNLLCFVNTIPLGEFVAAVSIGEASQRPLGFADEWIWVVWLVADTLLYLTIAWYSSNVIAGQFGPARPLHFFLQRNYWCPPRVFLEEGDEQSSLLSNQVRSAEPSRWSSF